MSSKYTRYLRMVGADYRDSGSESTADDYARASLTIDVLADALRQIADTDDRDRPASMRSIARIALADCTLSKT